MGQISFLHEHKLSRITISFFFSKKNYKKTVTNKISLVDYDKVISDDKQLFKTFGNLFQETVKTLSVSDSFNISNYSHSDLVNNAIRNYENHSNMKNIRETITFFLAAIWNQELILNKTFSQKLKLVDITLVYKKEDSTKVKKS